MCQEGVEEFMLTESDTESVNLPRRRLVLQFARDDRVPQESVEADRQGDDPQEEEDLIFVPHSRAMAAGFRSLDEVNLEDVFEVRALVMKSIPKFLRGVFRGALKVSLQEIVRGQQRNDSEAESRGWKLFLLLPRMLLSRPPRGGLVPKARLRERVDRFGQGGLGDAGADVLGVVIARDDGKLQET